MLPQARGLLLASLRMDQLPAQRWAELPLGLGSLGLGPLGPLGLGPLGPLGLEREPSVEPRLREVLNRHHCRAY